MVLDDGSTLNLGRQIKVHVKDAAGAPVTGAQVQAKDAAGTTTWSATTDEAGNTPTQAFITATQTGTRTIAQNPDHHLGHEKRLRASQPHRLRHRGRELDDFHSARIGGGEALGPRGAASPDVGTTATVAPTASRRRTYSLTWSGSTWRYPATGS